MKINKYNVTNTFAEPNEKLLKFKIKNLLFNSTSESSYFNEVHNIVTLDSLLSIWFIKNWYRRVWAGSITWS